jgi:hypothetical protein
LRTSGPGDSVEVVATVHAGSQDLADGVRLERVAGEESAAALRIRYPSGVQSIRYRSPDEHSVGFGLSYSTYDYDGLRYRISSGQGQRVWADLEVRVPARLTRARFHNLVGLVEAEGLEGALAFGFGTANVRLRRLSGELSLEGSSGDVRASEIRGTWASRSSSGDCELEGFDGETILMRSSSGDIRSRRLRAGRVEVETSSGNADLIDSDLAEFRGQSSSGDLSLDAAGSRLQEIRAHTSSGNVTVRLPRDAPFDATAEQSSGDMEVGFSDGTATRRGDRLVGYRRGSGGTRIRLETSSGDVEISPR